MYIVSALVTDREPAVFGDPSQPPLHDPPLCRPNFSEPSMPFLAMRRLMARLLKARAHFLSS